MYLWDIKELKSKLASGQDRDRDIFIYVFVYFILERLFAHTRAMVENKGDLTTPAIAAAAVSIVISIAGIRYVYAKNGGAEGVQLLNRFVPLFWVLAIRFGVLITLVAVPVFFGISFIAPHFLDGLKQVIAFVVGPAISAYFYWCLGGHIAQVAQASKAPAQPLP